MAQEKLKSFTLGLDLGPSSIGWALLENKKGGQHIVNAGARVFNAGLDKLETDGRGESRNVERRVARLARRRLDRLSRRLTKLANILQKAGLLPRGELAKSEHRHLFFKQLDSILDSPYQLRKRALDEKVEPFELGRIFYHICQRRGFLSNRKATPKKEEEAGKVQQGIVGLAGEMVEKGARTYGELFAQLEPTREPIRGRYTSREKYKDEFEKIWDSQKRFYAEILTDKLKEKIEKAIFFQRPLKSQKKFLGDCELVKDRKRAPWALLQAQRFRYLQKVNDLRAINESTGEVIELSPEQRQTITENLELQSDMTFGGIRRLLKELKNCKFNLENGGEKKIPGNHTAARLAKIFGTERWGQFSDSEKDSVVEDYLSIVKDETLKRRGIKHWGLSEESGDEFSKVSLESGYCSFSRQALHKLLPRLQKGQSLQSAIKEVYTERWARTGQALESLPSVDSENMPVIRNPVVSRTLTELRRIVNAIIGRYGKPKLIRIELARDLRQTSKQRKDTWKNNRLNQKNREEAADLIDKKTKIEDPSRDDILKVLLAEECNWECPYTGRNISMAILFGSHPQFDIEHIIPHDRCLDDSYINKTLCYAEENRNVKRNRTPYEAYYGTDKWDGIIERVSKFKGDARREKLRRFKMTTEQLNEEILSDFTNRQLNDTRYAAKLSKQYLGLLYGGVDDDGIDANHNRRIYTTKGQMTAVLRRLWGLNKTLGEGEVKSRDDHRHHVVDAIVVALSDGSKVKMLSDAAKRTSRVQNKLFAKIPPPWDNFRSEVLAVVNEIVASHRVNNRVRGTLHAQTFYGRPHTGKDGKYYVVSRTPVNSLSEKDVGSILEPVVRKAVENKLRELGKPPKAAFKDERNHPFLIAGDGRKIPIHRVKIRYALATFPVGKGPRLRHVATDTNHHIEIVEIKDETGKIKWEGHVVSLFVAYQRKINRLPIIKRDFGEDRRFLFSLSKGELITLKNKDGQQKLFVVRGIVTSNGNIRFAPVNDARPLAVIGKKGLTLLPNRLRANNCNKVFIAPMGEVRTANN